VPATKRVSVTPSQIAAARVVQKGYARRGETPPAAVTKIVNAQRVPARSHAARPHAEFRSQPNRSVRSDAPAAAARDRETDLWAELGSKVRMLRNKVLRRAS
jgi:hypothetical protein